MIRIWRDGRWSLSRGEAKSGARRNGLALALGSLLCLALLPWMAAPAAPLASGRRPSGPPALSPASAVAVAPVAAPAAAPAAAPPSRPSAHVCGPPVPGTARCHAIFVTDSHGAPLASGSPLPGSYGPGDLQSAYAETPASLTAGQTVALVDAFDDPAAEADLGVYRRQY